jgi:hypothetical protein
VDLGTDKIPTRFSDEQKIVLGSYQMYLTTTRMSLDGDTDGDTDEDTDAFHQTLSSILFRDKHLQMDLLGKLACPIQSYMALIALRSVGRFVNANLVTQPISRLIYLSRGLVLLIALDRAKGANERRFMM